MLECKRAKNKSESHCFSEGEQFSTLVLDCERANRKKTGLDGFLGSEMVSPSKVMPTVQTQTAKDPSGTGSQQSWQHYHGN